MALLGSLRRYGGSGAGLGLVSHDLRVYGMCGRREAP